MEVSGSTTVQGIEVVVSHGTNGSTLQITRIRSLSCHRGTMITWHPTSGLHRVSACLLSSASCGLQMHHSHLLRLESQALYHVTHVSMVTIHRI